MVFVLKFQSALPKEIFSAQRLSTVHRTFSPVNYYCCRFCIQIQQLSKILGQKLKLINQINLFEFTKGKGQIQDLMDYKLRKMNLGILCIFFALLIQFMIAKDLNCLTGYKILVRQTLLNKKNQKEYKLMTKCLCPNNYFGPQCESHVDIDCYMSASNSLNQINQSNIKDQMSFDLDFEVQCWVHPKSSLGVRTELRQYLSNYNQDNAFGVRDQFGNQEEIIWANTTDIFDSKGELKAITQMQARNKSQTLNNEEILKLTIGNNSILYQTPFQYQEYFLGFGLINGNILFRTTLIDPEKGSIDLANFSINEVQVQNVQDYISSYNSLQQIERESKSLAKNITDLIKNGTINETVEKYINGSSNIKDLNKFGPKQSAKKQLPQFKVPIKVNPFNSTFYSTIRIELGIIEKYQQVATHQVSLNSLLWTIPVNVDGIGLPVPLQKHLTVTDSGNKSYYRIIFVIIIGAFIYFGLKYAHQKYKQWKNKQYSQFNEQDQLSKESKRKIQNKGQNHHASVRTNSSAYTTQQYQLKEHIQRQ